MNILNHRILSVIEVTGLLCDVWVSFVNWIRLQVIIALRGEWVRIQLVFRVFFDLRNYLIGALLTGI